MKNSAPEKWEYKEHTRVKHELLRKYLFPWMIVLGKFYRKILFFDCFAGRGKYTDGTLGSPIIALQVANRILCRAKQKKTRKPFDKFICVAVEKDKENHVNLENVVNQEKGKLEFVDSLEVDLINDEFANVVDDILSYFKEKKQRIAPSFFFIDPFGYTGVPFKTVEQIMSFDRTEIFFTFMTRDINRFLKFSPLEKTLDGLFESSEWREIIKMPDSLKRDQALKDLYIRCLIEKAKVKYVFPFRVSMDVKRQTLYYLIHATNSFKGFKIMKDIMHSQGVSGEFSYLGPDEVQRRDQMSLFGNDIGLLVKYLMKKFAGQRITFEKILESTYIHTQFVEKHYRAAIKKLREDNLIDLDKVGPRGGIKDDCEITFPENNPVMTVFPQIKEKYLKVHYKQYKQLNGVRKTLVERINDGSIITRFDKTPLPKKSTDVVCPHFLELKWAYGCPYDCAWCYLKGTFRFKPDGIKPVIKDIEKIKIHTLTFLHKATDSELLNTGEIADSLMAENPRFAFSKMIIPIFEQQDKHKVLFLTKSDNIKNLIEIEQHNQVIMSFTLNAFPVAKKWEKGAPAVEKRIEAAKKLSDLGYEIRIRIDPMVPVQNWELHYTNLFKKVFSQFVPKRITLGSLRGLQSTLNITKDNSWKKYLKESSNWGKKVEFTSRYNMYSYIVSHLENVWGYKEIALCKETLAMWKKLRWDYRKIKCNCIW